MRAPTDSNGSLSSATLPISLPSPYSDSGEATDFFEPEERRELELRLLHHFITIVTFTFPACHEKRYRDLWTIDAVRSGFQHTFLFNAVLAISALHLLSDTRSMTYFYARDEDQAAVERVTKTLFIADNDKGRDLARIHRLYLNTAIRQQRVAISNLSSSNADAVFMTSLLLSYQSLRLIPDQSTSPSYSPPIQWLKMCKAVATIIEIAWPMLQNDSMMALILAYSTEPDFKDEMAMFNPVYRKPFEALLDWSQHPEPYLDLEIKHTYEKTLAYVGGVYCALLNKEPPRNMIRRIVCLGVLAPARYIELLEQGRPRALVILAHHLALSQAIEEHWWFHGVADRVVKGIQSILPAEWQWAMDWPLSMIRVAGSQS
ncbi:hypothetical protein MMC17_007872 [Xylographa soralifera]|nr:hypothetical protein [Xylographa soralifera]